VALPAPGVKALAGLTVACLVAGGASFAEAYRATAGQRHLVPAPVVPVAVPPTTTPPTTTPPTTAPRLSLPIKVAPPVQVDIPAVGLAAPVVAVGLDTSRQLDIPAPSLAGWYRLGPAPGAIGPAVIVGHVDTYTGPGVFYRLTAVRTGDEVDIVHAGGARSRFVITAVTVVTKAAFPSAAVFAPTSGPTLRLITCTGAFNPTSRHYVDSLIAWARAV
jgi:hypothetical protein